MVVYAAMRQEGVFAMGASGHIENTFSTFFSHRYNYWILPLPTAGVIYGITCNICAIILKDVALPGLVLLQSREDATVQSKMRPLTPPRSCVHGECYGVFLSYTILNIS